MYAGTFLWWARSPASRWAKRPSDRMAGLRICLAKSSTSDRRERIRLELVWERLRVVPKGHWKLAGGANHRFFVNIESKPQPGLRKTRAAIPSPLPGLAAFSVRNR